MIPRGMSSFGDSDYDSVDGESDFFFEDDEVVLTPDQLRAEMEKNRMQQDALMRQEIARMRESLGEDFDEDDFDFEGDLISDSDDVESDFFLEDEDDEEFTDVISSDSGDALPSLPMGSALVGVDDSVGVSSGQGSVDDVVGGSSDLVVEDEDDSDDGESDFFLEDEDDEEFTDVISSDASVSGVDAVSDPSGDSAIGVDRDVLADVLSEDVPETPQARVHREELDEFRRSATEKRKKSSRKSARRDDFLESNVVVSDDHKKVGVQDSQTEFRSRDAFEMVVEDDSGSGDGETEIIFGAQKRVRRKRSDGSRMRLAEQEVDFFKRLNSSVNKLRNDPDVRGFAQKALERDGSGVRAVRVLEQIVEGEDAFKKGRMLPGVNAKDLEVLRFLAMFKYATTRNISILVNTKQNQTNLRMGKLLKQGLVTRQKIYHVGSVWYLTEAGMLLTGLDVKRTLKSGVTYSMFNHTFTTNHVAAHLWSGGLNVLYLNDFPSDNRIDVSGNRVSGENLVSELQIQSSLTRLRGTEVADDFRPKIMNRMDADFKTWLSHSDRARIPSPEMMPGNEFMWTLLPRQRATRSSYHVPDLVIARPRAADGSPRSIAVEVEIANKDAASYERTLRAYADDERIYSKVVWVCHSRGAAMKLESIAKKATINLFQKRKISIVPVITEDGVFKGNDLWKI